MVVTVVVDSSGGGECECEGHECDGHECDGHECEGHE